MIDNDYHANFILKLQRIIWVFFAPIALLVSAWR